jgi:small subunit ribosomal protein S1
MLGWALFMEAPLAKKKTEDLFGDDASERSLSDFEKMLNSSLVSTRGLSTGDRFRGEVLSVGASEAFLSTGTPTDASMPLASNAERPKVGDLIDVIVVRAREGEILVKPVGSRGGDVEADNLEDAFDMELPVEGTVLEAVKGGFRVKIHERKAFCPISQMDWRCTDPAAYVGRKFEFLITKMERGRDLVVSRRRVLEQERLGSEAEFMNSAEVGGIYTATVFRIEKYGAFVRLPNGIEGLVPISELAWGRVQHTQDVVGMDQSVQVKLTQMVEEGDRLKLTFSLKQGGSVSDPWTTIDDDFPVGRQLEGTVEHKEAFGLFVNLALGITGLLPRSAWRDSVDGASYENKRKGDRVKVRIDRVDTSSRKISLSLPREEEDETWREHQSASTKPSSFGTMADLLKNVKVKS